jgi:hypothetical protein
MVCMSVPEKTCRRFSVVLTAVVVVVVYRRVKNGFKCGTTTLLFYMLKFVKI